VTALSIDDFRPRLGETFAAEGEAGAAALTLVEATPLADSGREGGSFRLEFAGPLEPVLPQAIYGFPLGEPRADIFIVPIGPKAGAMRYEAIFF
jgi:hypothetical protein